MKKIITAIIAVCILVPMFALSAWAAAPEMIAKAGAATVDGAISDGEYGDAFVLNKDNAVTWTQSTMEAEVKYYLSWTEDALYIAVSAPSSAFTTQLTAQLNFNPGKLIPDSRPGLFLGMTWTKETGTLVITQHNYRTALQKSISEANVADITEKVESKAVDNGTDTIIEARIPANFFKITNISNVSFNDLKLEANATLGASPYAIFFDGDVARAFCALENDTVGDWTMGQMKLGKITLQQGSGTEPTEGPANPTNTPSNDNGNPKTFDLGIVSLAAIALSSVVAVKKRK